MAIRFRCYRRNCQPELCPAKRIFSCLSPKQDAILGRERLARRYETGMVIVHHDTPAFAVFSVHSGLVKMCRSCSSGDPAIVGLRGPGDLLGVRAVLCGMPHPASAVAMRPSIVCAVPRESFLGVVRDCPELAMRLLRWLAKDSLLAEDQLIARAHLSVRARTARLLIGLGDEGQTAAAGSGSDRMQIAREEMAFLIGTTRETLSRTLNQFAKRGAVGFENGTVRVLDYAFLEEVAEE